MNSRERLFASLEGKPTDRTPIWLLFPYHSTGYYVDVRSHPIYKPIFEASKHCCVMLDRRSFRAPLFTPEVTIRDDTFSDGDWQVKRQYYKYKKESIFSEIRRNESETKIKKLVATDEELEFYCLLPVETDESRISAELDRQLPNYLRKKDEFPEEYGAMMLDLGEPVSPIYHAAKLEEYAVWSMTKGDIITKYLDRAMVNERIVYRWCLDRNLADVYFLVGSEMASPPLVSRKTFRKWIVPYAKELISLIHSRGKRAIQHYHGQIKLILEDFLEMSPDGLHTIEAPPTGNCTLSQAYAVAGDRITLIGNIQYDDFRSMTEEQMSAAVKAVLEEAAGRRFILSPSAGPYDENITDQMARNYMAFMKTGWEYKRIK